MCHWRWTPVLHFFHFPLCLLNSAPTCLRVLTHTPHSTPQERDGLLVTLGEKEVELASALSEVLELKAQVASLQGDLAISQVRASEMPVCRSNEIGGVQYAWM